MPGGLGVAVADSIFEIDPDQWDRCTGGIPVLRHGFFRALENSGVIGGGNTHLPRYVVLRDGSGEITACAPVMLKWGTKREFGPEANWLAGGLAAGVFVWPKAQACTPFFPRMTPKLLVRPDGPPAGKATLLQALLRLVDTPERRTAFNLMHVTADEARLCVAQGAVLSTERRSVWRNPGWGSLDEYLQSVSRRRRKAWRRERRQAETLGLRFDLVDGAEISEGLLADFYSGFEQVCARHGNPPWIPVATFRELIRQIPESVFLMTAHDGDRYVAGALRFVGAGTLYSDTWSAPLPPPPGVLATMACHLPVEYAIRHGLKTVDAGVFASYKTHRGYVAEPVYNAHWFGNPELAALARGVLQDSSE